MICRLAPKSEWTESGHVGEWTLTWSQTQTQSNFIMKCDKRTQNIESSMRMTVQKNIKKQNT